MNRWVIMVISVAGLLTASFGIGVMFPQITDLGYELGIPGVPFIVFVIAGASAGILYHMVSDTVGRKVQRALKSLALAYVIWLGTGVVMAVATEEGTLLQRVGRGDVIGLWFASFYVLTLCLPGSMGILAILKGAKNHLSGTLAILIGISVASMIYSEAAGNELMDQNLIISLVTVWGLVLFVEGMDIIRRLDEYVEGHMDPAIINRNLLFLSLFLVASSVLSIAVSVLRGPSGIYEFGTIHGKAALGLLILAPLGIIVLYRRMR